MDTEQLLTDYERDGVVLIRSFLTAGEVAAVRAELDRYIREDLASKPADAPTFETDNRLLLVYRGNHTQTDSSLKAACTAAATATPLA